MALVRIVSSVFAALAAFGIAATLIVGLMLQDVTVHESETAALTAGTECLLFGWVNSTATMEGIDDASVIALSPDFDINETRSDATGYYEMLLWRGTTIVFFDAPGHYSYMETIDTTGLAEFRIDALLESEPTVPTAEMTVDPDSNISRHRALTAHATSEDFNLGAVEVAVTRIHNRSGEWVNITLADMAVVGLSEYGDSVLGDMDYTHLGDVFEGDFRWAATTNRGGNLVSGGEGEYVFAPSIYSTLEGTIYGIPGYYSNSTLEKEGGFAWFDNDTGEYLRFEFSNLTGLEPPDLPDALPDDEEGVIVPLQTVETWRMGTRGIGSLFDWYDFGLAELDARSTLGMRFEYSSTVPSGDYLVIMLAMDDANNLNWTEHLITVDTDPPVADAGEEQTVAFGAEVVLYGGDSDDDVGIVNYTWSFDDDEAVVLYGESAVHSFVEAGEHSITLTVRDGGLNEDQDTTVVYVDDEVPVAQAGPAELTVPEDVPVIFDGGDSSDDSGIANYSWDIVELEESSTGSIFIFTFDQPGTYHVELTVIDVVGLVSAPDEVVVTVTDETSPVADAGDDLLATVGSTMVLDGSGSYDNVGIHNYTWRCTGSDTWELYGATVEVTFDTTGTYVVDLQVSDEAGNSDNDTLTIQVVEPPVADAGEDQDVRTGDLVQLDASGSVDDEGIENYTWTFEYDGETIRLYGETAEFTFDIEGTYDVNLTVTDGAGLMAHDEITVTVTDRPAGPSVALVAAVSLAIMVAIAAVAILAMKRKKD